jgi:di/tricarboxylate transporter
MNYEALITLCILGIFLVTVLSSAVAVDIALLGVMTALLVLGVLTPLEAFNGFANPALIIIACFYIVSAAIKETGAINWWIMRWLGNDSKPSRIMPRVILPVSTISSVISNTPVVAIFIPQIQDWARRHNLSASKLMMPLSFAAILGGTCSLIGTSTNILVVGLLESSEEAVPFHLFSPALVGIPLVIVCILYFATIGSYWLPIRKGVTEIAGDVRNYAVSMRVARNSPIIGKTIAQAGLRQLQHCFLSEIQAGQRIIPAVSPDEILNENDILIFTGQPEAVSELRQIRGLVPAEDNVHKLDVPYSSRALIEAVLAPASNLIGKAVNDSKFRTLYGGAILAVSRNGTKIDKKVGSIELRQGDNLLIEASQEFVKRHRYKRDFLLLSAIDESALPDQRKAPITLALLAFFILAVVSSVLPLASASLLLVCALGLCKCISIEYAQRSLDMRVLLAIGSSLALGFALQKTGLADLAAQGITSLAEGDPYLNLILLYLVTIVVTELITNNAAVIIMFPLAKALSIELDVSLLPFLITIMFGASISFLTPFGYQTNLMVQGPGGYKAIDYLRVGGPLSVLAAITVLFLVPIIWPF